MRFIPPLYPFVRSSNNGRLDIDVKNDTEPGTEEVVAEVHHNSTQVFKCDTTIPAFIGKMRCRNAVFEYFRTSPIAWTNSNRENMPAAMGGSRPGSPSVIKTIPHDKFQEIKEHAKNWKLLLSDHKENFTVEGISM